MIKLVQALQGGSIAKSETTRTFSVSRSSVKRFAKLVEQGTTAHSKEASLI